MACVGCGGSQDFYATVFLSNIASIFEQEAMEELKEKNQHKQLKYAEYRINRNILLGKLKNRLMEMMFVEDNGERDVHIGLAPPMTGLSPARECVLLGTRAQEKIFRDSAKGYLACDCFTSDR